MDLMDAVPLKVVEPDPDDQLITQDLGEGFNGRRPVLYHEPSNTVYLGGPDWYHADTYQHHGLDQWGEGKTHEGFVGGGALWGNGRLSWYHDPPAAHDQINEALEKTIPGITAPRNPNMPDPDDDDDWDDISGFHHPRP